jgi:hypothetical protein
MLHVLLLADDTQVLHCFRACVFNVCFLCLICTTKCNCVTQCMLQSQTDPVAPAYARQLDAFFGSFSTIELCHKAPPACDFNLHYVEADLLDCR